MKTFFILFTVLSLALYTAALCPYGCACIDDSVCSYYCAESECQLSIPIGNDCSGHYVHPRECGDVSYCDPSTFTCQFQKSTDEWCTYDYSCISGYCDYSSRTCQYENNDPWQYTILLTCIVVFTVFTVLIILTAVIVRRRRQLACMRYQNSCIGLPTRTPYMCQNPYTVGEMSPPPYSSPLGVPSAKPYTG